MIHLITVRNFKRFQAERFRLTDSMTLAGPNNAGKSTLLQSIATWKLGLDRWVALRKGDARSKAVRRTGVPVTRADLTSVPLREMNLLWESRRVTEPGSGGTPRLIDIIIEGGDHDDPWVCGLEFQYANPELVYVRPQGARYLGRHANGHFPPPSAAKLNIVHVPPLFGIERDEPRRERGMQDVLIGQGRPGDILRNLLWEIAQNNEKDWNELAGHISDLFGLKMRLPSYSSTQPYIICEYDEPGHKRPLDLSNAGSGTLQVLLLLAFLYARPATVMLLDEPDAHQHVILQREVHNLVRKIAHQRGGQIIVATHSEVILDATDPSRVLAFLGETQRTLAIGSERDEVREAMKRVTTTDLLLGSETRAILYVENETDRTILAEWARILDHPARSLLEGALVHWLRGRSLREAREHFFAMQAACPDICGVCLFDGDNRDEPHPVLARSGLAVLRWRRYEIENYLLHPASIKRFVRLPLLKRRVNRWFARQIPPGTDLFGDHPALTRIKASDEFLVSLLERMGMSTPKRDLYLLASVMRREEIHPEVCEKLDRIGEFLNPAWYR